jgi:hypothetical protein
MEVIKFVDRLTALRFAASVAVHAWEFVYDLSALGSSYQLHLPFGLLQLVSSVIHHGAVYFRLACISV